MTKQVLIVGGGFGGVRAALELERRLKKSAAIVLVANKPHFEYNPALYRYVTGSAASEVCIPLEEVFKGKAVTVAIDNVTSIDRAAKTATGASGVVYPYDTLVLALGSETTYFGIPGLKEHSYGMKSVDEALRLRNHINEMLLLCREDAARGLRLNHDATFIIIGAGATGVEMAGRLIEYAKKLAVEIGVDPALVSVTLIEAAERVLMTLPKEFTDPIAAHLRREGVHLMLSTAVMRQDVEEIFLKDAQMMASTVVWTSGVRANALYEACGLPVDKRGKVEVDGQLRAKGEDAIFVIGDGAQTKYSGWAQTAFYDGLFVAKTIVRAWSGGKLPVYAPRAPVNAIPAGDGWAAVLFPLFGRNLRIYGRVGWWLRRIADLRSFTIILPLTKAIKVFLGVSISEKCPICGAKSPHDHDAHNRPAP